MLPEGIRSLPELAEYPEARDRVVHCASLLEFLLKSLAPDGQLKTLDELLEHNFNRFSKLRRVQEARKVRNKLIHGDPNLTPGQVLAAEASFYHAVVTDILPLCSKSIQDQVQPEIVPTGSKPNPPKPPLKQTISAALELTEDQLDKLEDHWAVNSAKKEWLEEFIGRGSEPGRQIDRGEAAIDFSVRWASERRDVVRELIRTGYIHQKDISVAVTLQAGTTRVNPKDGLNYVWIPPGTFYMGCSPDDDRCEDCERPVRQVTITQGFWMGQTPVTQEAYQRVMGSNPSHFKGAKRPVESVNWKDVCSYCQVVGMRLPTEAEWEYAARAGTGHSRYGKVDQIAWYHFNSKDQTHDVSERRANPWGLYDMLGNVWELVADKYSDYPDTSLIDPKGPKTGVTRVIRGGSWINGPLCARVSQRYKGIDANYAIGFRCAGNVMPQSPEPLAREVETLRIEVSTFIRHLKNCFICLQMDQTRNKSAFNELRELEYYLSQIGPRTEVVYTTVRYKMLAKTLASTVLSAIDTDFSRSQSRNPDVEESLQGLLTAVGFQLFVPQPFEPYAEGRHISSGQTMRTEVPNHHGHIAKVQRRGLVDNRGDVVQKSLVVLYERPSGDAKRFSK